MPDRVLKKQSDRLPAGKTFPIRGKGLLLWAVETHCVSPAPARPCHKDRCNPHQQRPAPAGGGAGAGRGLWAPAAGQGAARGAVAGAMAPARMRTARAGGRVSRYPVRQPMRAAGTPSAPCYPAFGLSPILEARHPPIGRNPRTENAAGEAADPVSLHRDHAV